MYKSIRDAVRYRQKKVTGKSGDSGDDECDEAPNDESNDAFAFLTPTSQKFPRKTTVMGGAAETSKVETPKAKTFKDKDESTMDIPTDDANAKDNDSSTVYAYVSFLNYQNMLSFVCYFYECLLYFFHLFSSFFRRRKQRRRKLMQLKNHSLKCQSRFQASFPKKIPHQLKRKHHRNRL